MARYFEKISFSQFEKDFKDYENIKDLYDDIKLPIAKSVLAAGYDFISILDVIIKPGEVVKIPTGIKVRLNDDEFLGIYVRSSFGVKYNVRMCNQVGIIDGDYYNNDGNEGHIWICLQNEGNKEFIIRKGDGFAQGIFQKFLLSDNDTRLNDKRVGGFGSTTEGRE